MDFHFVFDRLYVMLRGIVGTFFLSSVVRASNPSGNTLALARLHLCHRHLDSGTHKLLARATVKVAFAYLQSRERERVLRLELRRQRLHIAAA